MVEEKRDQKKEKIMRKNETNKQTTMVLPTNVSPVDDVICGHLWTNPLLFFVQLTCLLHPDTTL